MHINGEFLVNRQFLLDNKIHNKIAGYEVITPFKVNDKIILVNRGWVNSNNRQSIPEILIQNKITSIYGYSYYYKKLYELDEDNYVNKWPLIIQNIEIDKISKLEERYEFLSQGAPKETIQIWLNWAIKLKHSLNYIGTIQATIWYHSSYDLVLSSYD